MKSKLLFILSLFIFYACSVNKNSAIPVQSEIDLSLKNFAEIKKEEINKKSKDISLGYFWGIGEGIYPTFANHKFEIPKSYQRPENNFILNVDYFFTEDNQTKFKMYEWNDSEKKETLNNQFSSKFEDIKNYITKNIGKPNSELYEDLEKSDEQTVRDEIKWKSQNLNAYLFRFKGKGGFNQIRLAIYND